MESIMLKKVVVRIFTVLTLICFTGFLPTIVYSQEKINIGILRQIDIKPFFDAEQGVKDALELGGYDESKVNFISIAINNQIDTVQRNLEELRKQNVKLICTIGTSVTIETLKNEKDIPVVYNIVSYPESITDAGKKYGFSENYTGATNKVASEPMIKMALKLKKIDTIGMIFNAKEENAVRDVENIEKDCERLGIKSIIIPYTEEEKIVTTFKKLIDIGIDCLLFPKDTLQVKYLNELNSIIYDNKVLAFGLEASFCERDSAVLAFAAPTYKVGLIAGKKAVEVLNGKNPSDIPVEGLDKFDIYLNTRVAKKIHMNIPVNILKIASEVIK